MLELVEGTVPYFHLPFLEEKAPVKAVFSTRQGGISQGAFGTLNLGFHVGDDPGRVLNNRRLLASAAGLPLETWVVGEQVHGAKVAVVGKEEKGRGADSLDTAIKGVDGLATSEPGITLVAFFADCVPIYLVDPVRRAIALAHAGWRGTLFGIATQAVTTLLEAFNCKPLDLWAVIGPAIGPCCYKVDEQMAENFKKELPWAEQVLKAGGNDSWYLDLWEANRLELLDYGLSPQKIAVARTCTFCHPELFFSHRRDGGHTGRLAALLSCKED